MGELDLLSFLLTLDEANLTRTHVLPELTITRHPGGFRLTHQIEAGQVEVEQSSKGKQQETVMTIRLDNVFGEGRTLQISENWVQIDDRVYEFKKTVKSMKDELAG
jgi:hypothetical protein